MAGMLPTSWGEPTRTLVPWRQGFSHPTRNECMDWFAQITSYLPGVPSTKLEYPNIVQTYKLTFGILGVVIFLECFTRTIIHPDIGYRK